MTNQFQPISSETKLLTKEIIDKYANMDCLPTDRVRFRPNHVARLRKKLHAGEWGICNFVTIHVEEGNLKVRGDGQHCSKMLSQEPPELWRGCKCREDVYRVKTLSDAMVLFNTFNAKISVKQVSVVNRSYADAAGIPGPDELPGRVLDACVSALRQVHFSREEHLRAYENASQEDAARLVLDEENKNFVLWVGKVFAAAKNGYEKYRKVAVVVAMCMTYFKNKKDANTFWLETINGTNPDGDSPTRKCQLFVIQTKTASRRDEDINRKDGSKPSAPLIITAKCLHFWKGFRTGSQDNFKRPKPGVLPEIA